jgi:hypothetical protein
MSSQKREGHHISNGAGKKVAIQNKNKLLLHIILT